MRIDSRESPRFALRIAGPSKVTILNLRFENAAIAIAISLGRQGGNHEFFTAMSLALAGYAINEVFEADMKALLGNIADVKEAPSKTFGRMYNKLMNKAEHGDPTIPKPRPMKNVDIDRVGAVIEKVEQLERAFDALQGKFKILRIKNNYDPTGGEGFGGYRSLLVNFEYPSGLTYAELFGSGHYTGEVHEALDPVAQMWLDYVETLRPVGDWRWGLQGLWRVARLDPDCEVVLASEVQMIMQAYMTGRHMSHLLYKISRCETGPSEMARDFATSFTATSEEMLQKAKDLVALYRAIWLRSGYGLESCDANGPRNTSKTQNLAKRMHMPSPTFSSLVVRNRS